MVILDCRSGKRERETCVASTARRFINVARVGFQRIRARNVGKRDGISYGTLGRVLCGVASAGYFRVRAHIYVVVSIRQPVMREIIAVTESRRRLPDTERRRRLLVTAPFERRDSTEARRDERLHLQLRYIDSLSNGSATRNANLPYYLLFFSPYKCGSLPHPVS